ncbi:hypothetical protein YC2023_024052 [Brassica napus]
MEMRNASNVGQSESYAHRPQLGHAGESCSKQAADTMIQGEHQSSGKRIASQIVTPSCQVPDDNVTKRARVSPRLLTFSPKETVLPGDAPIIGALNDMEIMEPCMEDGSKDALLVADDHEDDLLGADLMDMEANVVDKLVVDVRMPDKATKGGVSSSGISKGAQILCKGVIFFRDTTIKSEEEFERKF